MSQGTSISADLRDTSFASAVGQLVRAKGTGVLLVHDVIGTSRAFFLEGAPQGAKLSRLKNPIGRILVDQGQVSEEKLNEALDVHNKTDKLLGQVLIELGILDEAGVKTVMQVQSRLNFLSLFGTKEGRIEFEDGLVHLTDFTPAPMSALMAMYEGVKDYGRAEVTSTLLAKLAFASVCLSETAQPLVDALPPAEQMATRLLESYRFTGDLARSVPLEPKALAALLFALDELGGLQIGPAVKVPRA